MSDLDPLFANENLRKSLVRADDIEAWAVRLYAVETLDGRLGDLGPPRAASPGFIVAKALRLHDASDRSIVLTIGGVRQIIFFTGITKTEVLPAKLNNVLTNLPMGIGYAFAWIESLVIRAVNPHNARLGKEAAQAWCSVLEGRADPRALPLLYDTIQESG